MSGVTAAQLNARIALQSDSDAVIGSVNHFLRENYGGGAEFIEVVKHPDLQKRHQGHRVYKASFNQADIEVILRAIDQASWPDKRSVQVYVSEQEERNEFFLRYSGGSRKEETSR
jgi:hypothetical protein